MMTILATINPEKRSIDTLSSNGDESRQRTTKKVKRVSNTNNNKSVSNLSNSDNNNNDNDNGSFASKMILQLAKSAISSLNEDNQSSNSNTYDESPIDSLAHTISLPNSNPKSINSKNLSLIISQLTSEIARFDSSRALPLIHSILKINWIYHSSKLQNFSKNYATFLTVLVSTMPLWWKDVASKIIYDFTKADPSILSSHHETLKKMISLVPTSSNSLPNLLKANFPNKNSPKDEIINYVKNILNMTEYYHVLINYVWTLIFENFIKLDVDFQNQIDEIDDDDLSEALGFDESDSENDDADDFDNVDDVDNDDDDDDDDDDDEEMRSGSEDEDDNEDYDDENANLDVDATNLKTLDDNFSDSSDENDDCSYQKNRKTKIIKKVKFTKDTKNLNDSEIEETETKNDNTHDDEDDDEFDDETLDSEAGYTIELESLSDLSNKIDSLLSSILEYLKPNLLVESLESKQGIPIFNALINVFRTIILPTHGTKATQYIIFYAAQQQPELIDAFLVSLFEIIFSTDKKKGETLQSSISSSLMNNLTNIGSINIKITGIQYLASFVARGKNLSDTQIASVVTFLVDYCTAYMEEHDDDDDDIIVDHHDAKNNRDGENHSNPSSRSNSNTSTIRREFNPTKHSLFYSLVQALMYIICFRKKSLRESDDPINKTAINNDGTNSHKTGWVAALDKFFTRVIISKYDPLRWCNETVVLIFSRVAQSEGICYTWSVIERIRRERVGRVSNDRKDKNNNNSLPASSSSSSSTPMSISMKSSNVIVGTQSSMRATQEFLDLIAVFPFDPLLLKKSKRIVEATYVQWDNGEDDEEDEND